MRCDPTGTDPLRAPLMPDGAVKPLPAGERQIGERLRQLVSGYQITQAIYVAVTLRLPDLLAGGPRTADDLAVEAKSDARSLYRLLRALGALGIVTEEPHGARRSFTLTEMGHLLRGDIPGSLDSWAALVARPYHWDAWGDLLHTVRTGEDAFAARHGVRASGPGDHAIPRRAGSSTRR